MLYSVVHDGNVICRSVVLRSGTHPTTGVYVCVFVFAPKNTTTLATCGGAFQCFVLATNHWYSKQFQTELSFDSPRLLLEECTQLALDITGVAVQQCSTVCVPPHKKVSTRKKSRCIKSPSEQSWMNSLTTVCPWSVSCLHLYYNQDNQFSKIKFWRPIMIIFTNVLPVFRLFFNNRSKDRTIQLILPNSTVPPEFLPAPRSRAPPTSVRPPSTPCEFVLFCLGETNETFEILHAKREGCRTVQQSHPS